MKKKVTFLATLFFIMLTFGSYAQIGYDCNTPNVITSLPYLQTGFNTNTVGNPFNDTNACASTYMTGNDYVFEFTPAYYMNISIALTNTGQSVGLFVADKCFDDITATCVASATSLIGNPSLPNVALTGGVTYYILVSTDSLMGFNDTTAFDIEINELIQIDAAVTSITEPVSGCDLGTQPVTAVIENLGVDSLYNFDLTCDFNGAGTNTETITDTILPGGSLTYTFIGQVVFTAVGNYTINVYTSISLDGDLSNDTAEVIVVNIPVLSSFPYTEDFESGNGYWFSGGTNSSWELGTPADSVINHAASGVNAWKTNLIADHNANETSYVESPCFDFSSLIKPIIDLNVWYETTMIGAATLESSIDNGATWQVVGANGDPNNWYNGSFTTGWNGNSGNYLLAKHLLNGLGGQLSVKLRIAFSGGIAGTSEGFAFDDIHIYDTPADDIGVIEITTPNSGCGLGNEIVIVNIANFGTAQQSNFDVTYSPNGGVTLVTETVSALLLPDDTITYQFATTSSFVTPGTYYMLAMTELAGDADNSNDTVFKTVESYQIVSTYPYVEDFDTDTVWTAGGTNSSWDIGTPAKAVINYAASSPNSWVTNLTGDHNANEDSWVEGPCMDFTSLDNPYVQLDVWTATTLGAGTMEVSTDFGTTWAIIGANGDPFNWYNGSLLGATGWSGTSAGDWSTAVHKLDGLEGAPSVKLRVHYNGGMILTSEGMAFDNVHVFECIPPVAGFTSSINEGTVDFTNTSLAATSYLWDFGDGGSSISQDPTYTYTTNGTYPVMLIVTNNCESDTFIQNVTVCIPPVADFTFTSSGSNVTFTSTSTNATTYDWDFGDGGSSTSQNPSHNYTSNGTYPVILIVTSSCGADTVIYNVLVNVGLNDHSSNEQLKVYPNPTNDICLMTYTGYAENAAIIIYDMRGQKVYSRYIGDISGTYSMTIDLTSVAKGVYYIKFEKDTENTFTRITVE